jgi:hypothetical protein
MARRLRMLLRSGTVRRTVGGLGLTRRTVWREAGTVTEIVGAGTVDEDDKQALAQLLVAQARSAGIDLVGPGGC